MEMISSDRGIQTSREYDRPGEINAYADVPNRLFSTNITVTVKFQEDHAIQFTLSESVAAM